MSMRLHSVLASLVATDAAVCLRIHKVNQRPSVHRFFHAISRLGDGWFWYALMAVLLVLTQGAAVHAVLHMIGAGLVGLVVYKGLKRHTLRPRPCDRYAAIHPGTAALDEFSFPSGHTLHAVLFSTVALAYYPVLAPLLLSFTALVALSRLVLGLHYPSDVCAGAALGYALAALSFLL